MAIIRARPRTAGHARTTKILPARFIDPPPS
jgi:hypothetical protein